MSPLLHHVQNSKPASLFGGKAFAYERLIAIFESILDDRREYSIGSVAVAGQVSNPFLPSPYSY
jgi:hypothetical protein